MRRARALRKIVITVLEVDCVMAEAGDELYILDETRNGKVFQVAKVREPMNDFYATCDQIEVLNDSVH